MDQPAEESAEAPATPDRRGIEETLHLTSSLANASRLKTAIGQLEAGGGVERRLLEP